MWSTWMQMLGRTKTHNDYLWLGYHTLFSLLVYQSSIWKLWVVSFVNHTGPWLDFSSAAAAWHSQFMVPLALTSLARRSMPAKSAKMPLEQQVSQILNMAVFFDFDACECPHSQNFGCSSYHSANGWHLEVVMERWGGFFPPAFSMPEDEKQSPWKVELRFEHILGVVPNGVPNGSKSCQFNSQFYPVSRVFTLPFPLLPWLFSWNWLRPVGIDERR